MGYINITLADGSSHQLSPHATALDLMKLAPLEQEEERVAVYINDELHDLRDPLPDGAQIRWVTANSKDGLEVIRHSAEHLLATAVIRLFKKAQVTMGPKSHQNDFYYDFDLGGPVSPEDLLHIENEMKTLAVQNIPFKKSWLSKEEAAALFKNLGQYYKPQILEWIKDDRVSLYQSGDFIDLCRGPHVPHTGFIKAFKLLNASGSYWRADASKEALQRISGIAFANEKDLEEYLYRLQEAKKRDHRKLGPGLELFSVSETYDSHEYPAGENIEVLITARVSAQMAKQEGFENFVIVQGEMVKKLREVFAPCSLSINSSCVTQGELDLDKTWEADFKIFSAHLSKEQKSKIGQLQEEIAKSHSKGRLQLTVQPHYTEEIGPGLVTWLPKGGRVRIAIEDLIRQMHFQAGYEMVFTPHLAKSDLWKVSGHWSFYRQNMFAPMIMDGQEYVMKPMNCPFHILIYKNRPRSYRDLPLRLAELGTVYRYELTGVMHGLMRVRGFTQDDAHLFCAWEQIEEEIDRVIGFILQVLKTFGFSHFIIHLATQPEKYVGLPQQWQKAEQALLQAVKRHDLPYQIDAGGGAFYGPKIDIHLRDGLNRLWQCSTVQLDFNNPERFDLTYINDKGQPEQPVMIHRALLGSIERFMGILIEEYAGAFPVWLAPEQIRILTIADRHLPYANYLTNTLKQANLRVFMPSSKEKLGAKIRDAQLSKVPIMLVIGDAEVEKKGACIRLRSGQDEGFMDEKELLSYCLQAAQIPNIAPTIPHCQPQTVKA